MKKGEQFLLKRKILSEYPIGLSTTIGDERFNVTRHDSYPDFLILSRMITVGEDTIKVGEEIQIENVLYSAVEDTGKILFLKILSVKLPEKTDVIIFDEDLSPIEKKFILEDYPVGFEFKMDGATFLVVKNNEEEITLRPTMNNLWYKTNEESTKCRLIENGEIVEKSL
jgi:hypothetical protein